MCTSKYLSINQTITRYTLNVMLCVNCVSIKLEKTSEGRPHKVVLFAKGLLGNQALPHPDKTKLS